jgi:hypothetical protein
MNEKNIQFFMKANVDGLRVSIGLASNPKVEWLALLLLIREVPGSNIDPETGYPE